jgi:hypothetical protein
MDTPTGARIKKIVFENKKEITYNLHVDNYENFSVNGGLIVHNSIKAHMYALEPLSRTQGSPSILSGTIAKGKKDVIEIRKAERKNMREVLKAQRKENREKIKEIEKKKKHS